MTQETALTEFINSPDYQKFLKDWHKFYKRISQEETPRVDGSGRKIVDKRPDGYDYIIEAYMRECLDRHFPGWSWEMGGAPQFLGSEWVVIWGTLSIIDEHLLAFGVNPPIRRFSATNAVRIKYKSKLPHTMENIIDIGNDVSAGNSKAFKKAINQLTHIGDDVYGKRIEEEGAGSYETVFELSPDVNNFQNAVADLFVKHGKQVLWSKILKYLGVSSLNDITDFKAAYAKLVKEVTK